MPTRKRPPGVKPPKKRWTSAPIPNVATVQEHGFGATITRAHPGTTIDPAGEHKQLPRKRKERTS